tara:strand:- start:275 stop:841 length:567 start_codon:yes stop_codon:yes gene_type:complete
MSKYFNIIIYIFFVNISFGQNNLNPEKIKLSKEDITNIIESEQKLKEWIGQLKEPGVRINGENMEFNAVAQALISNKELRNIIYKENYSFEDVKKSLEQLNIQLAFWQMINIYPNNKKKVLEYIYSYDSLIPVDEIVIASFYTYSFFDPKVTKIIDNKPVVERPDIFEQMLLRTKEIVAYVQEFRKRK